MSTVNPEKIGKYTVIELLGRGGMGEVYLGEDPYIGRRVAIKVIKGADPEARDRFLHEAKVIGGLTHPAIVSLLDFDFSGTEPFLVMEYLKGEGLDAWIRNPHSLAQQLVILDDLCHALSYAHENGVLHRDVKPSNVQILPNGHAKLMDFGIARAAAGKLTATGSVMGTPEYMAPEILNDAAYSPRSDLYACAVLLYEMFTGTNPFAAKTLAASLTNVLTLNPPDIRVAHPDFPKRLASTLMACLHKLPELRPEGFAALIAAGREASGGPPMAAIPETRAIPTLPPPGAAPSAVATGPSGFAPRGTRRAWLAGAFVTAVVGLIWVLSPGPVTAPPGLSLTASPSLAPVTAVATPEPVPTPSAPSPSGREGAPAPKPSRSARDQAESQVAAPPRQTPAATPMPASPVPPSVAPPAATPTPQPRPSAPPEALASPTTLSAAPTPLAVAAPVVHGVSPRTMRRGSSVDLEIRGEGFRKDLKAVVLQGRRPAEGIRVLRQEFVSAGVIRVRVLVEAETPLLTYSIVFQDAGGVTTQGVQIEVVL